MRMYIERRILPEGCFSQWSFNKKAAFGRLSQASRQSVQGPGPILLQGTDPTRPIDGISMEDDTSDGTNAVHRTDQPLVLCSAHNRIDLNTGHFCPLYRVLFRISE